MPSLCVHIPSGHVKKKSIPITRANILIFCCPTRFSETGFPHPFSLTSPGWITRGKALPPTSSSTRATVCWYLCHGFRAFTTKRNKIAFCGKINLGTSTSGESDWLHYALRNSVMSSITDSICSLHNFDELVSSRRNQLALSHRASDLLTHPCRETFEC